MLARTLLLTVFAITALAAPIGPEPLEARGGCQVGFLLCLGPNGGIGGCANPRANQYCCTLRPLANG